jgi:hypothetical protein
MKTATKINFRISKRNDTHEIIDGRFAAPVYESEAVTVYIHSTGILFAVCPSTPTEGKEIYPYEYHELLLANII